MSNCVIDETTLPPLALEMVADCRGLVSPPDICLKVAELAQSSDTSMADIGEVIIRDPNLTARLLGIVNSAYYNLRSQVDTVSRALTVIGLGELQSLILAISAVKSFSSIPNGLVNIDTFWRHGIYSGLIARSLSRRVDVLHPERLFIAGLLHDIGALVLYNRLPEVCRDLLLSAQGDEELLFQAEQDELGFTHAELGALLMGNWQVPAELQAAIGYHHNPLNAPVGQLEAALVNVANVLANRSGIGGYCEHTRDTSQLDPAVLALIGLDKRDFGEEQVLSEAAEQFSQTASILAAA